jgi:hypothetical protein
MDETDIQRRHEFNHATAEASSEEMTPPLALPLPQGPLDALRGYVSPPQKCGKHLLIQI